MQFLLFSWYLSNLSLLLLILPLLFCLFFSGLEEGFPSGTLNSSQEKVVQIFPFLVSRFREAVIPILAADCSSATSCSTIIGISWLVILILQSYIRDISYWFCRTADLVTSATLTSSQDKNVWSVLWFPLNWMKVEFVDSSRLLLWGFSYDGWLLLLSVEKSKHRSSRYSPSKYFHSQNWSNASLKHLKSKVFKKMVFENWWNVQC